MGFKLAELFVDIKARDDSLQKQVGAVRGQLTALGVAVGTAGGNLAASAIAGAGAALAGFFKQGVTGAVALQDTLAATNAIFGGSASIITRQADEMAAKFGTVKTEFIEAAQGFGAAFKAIGTPVEDAARLGNQLTKLGMDMASFKGTSNAEVFTALSAALRGEFDPLERFNVMLSAAAVEQEALNLGLIKSAKEMDEAAKKQATLSLIMKKSVDMQGDLERTAGDTGNAWRKFTGTIENTADSIGMSLMPAISAIVTLAGDMATDLAASFEASKGAFEAFAAGVVDVVSAIGVAWRNLPSLWEITTIKAREMGLNLIAIFKVIPANLGVIGEYIANNWRELIADGLNAVGALFKNLASNIGKFAQAVWSFIQDPTKGFQFNWTPLLDGFKATAAALPELARPELVSLQEEIDRVAGQVADRETKRAAEIADRAKAAAKPAQAVAAKAARKTAEFKSEASGVSEFALKLRASIYDGQDDTAKKQLEAQQKTAASTAKIAEAIPGLGLMARLS